MKVDAQSSAMFFQCGDKSYNAISRAIHTGLEGSIGVNFCGSVINCMGMSPENVWNRPGFAISRSSDDFVPEKPDGFAEHAMQNVYNSLWQGLFYWNDWDMFWSEHADSRRNSMLRAVSGGPVYISDRLGQSDIKWIWPLVWKDGALLRCDSKGVPTLDCLLVSPVGEGRLLKVFNQYCDTYLMAAFNLGENDIQDFLRFSDFPQADGSYVVYDWCSRCLSLLKKDNPIPLHVAQGESKIYILVPSGDGLTAIGLIDKYLSVAGITEKIVRDGSYTIFLRQGGEFAFYCSKKPKAIKVDGRDVEPECKDGLYILKCDGDSPVVNVAL